MTDLSPPPVPDAAELTAEALVRAYLDALSSHDLERCMSFFAPDGWIEMMNARHTGAQELAEWHRQRFAADFRLLNIQAVRSKGDRIVVDAAISTKRLRFFRLSSVSGRATLRVENGAITEVRLALRGYNPVDGIKFR